MAKFDISTLELPSAAAKPLYAGVGVTDLAVEKVRDVVTDVQKSVRDLDAKDIPAKANDVIKSRRAQVRSNVKARVDENVSTVTGTYSDLAKRGESLVTRIRKQESTQETVSAAKTTKAKAKTTNTQAKKTADSAAKTASSARKSVAKTAKKSPARSSAKATNTSAKKTATKATQAAGEAAAKVGD